MLRSLLLCLALLLAPMAPGVGASKPVILVLGDSLSAGYGIDIRSGWVHLLKQKLADEGLSYAVVNAAVSGETTRGGLTRLPGLLERHQPALVLIQLGGNDGLRALPTTDMRDNLAKMVALSREADAEPVLFAMHIPANYGPDYTARFTGTFAELAKDEDVALMPFLLGRIAFDASAFQDDGIHPTAAAQPKILSEIWPALEPLLRQP